MNGPDIVWTIRPGGQRRVPEAHPSARPPARLGQDLKGDKSCVFAYSLWP
jgi:hypothetical protein